MSVHEPGTDEPSTDEPRAQPDAQAGELHPPAGGATRATRADRFARELADLKIPDPAAARSVLWLRLGGLLMLAGLVLGALAFPLAHATDSSLGQGDALALGLGGVCASVVGGALFLRYGLAGFLRYWLARQSFDLAALGEKIHPATPEGEARNGVPHTDPAPR